MNINQQIIKDLAKCKENQDFIDFYSRLTPGLDKKSILGVKIPNIRKVAKLYKDNPKIKDYLHSLPHKYNEEYLFHDFIINDLKDYEIVINEVNNLLPYINNWAVCDSLIPKAFIKNKDKLIIEINRYLKSKETFTVRFGIKCLMTYYLGDKFNPKYLELVKSIKSNEYYIQMMQAWYFAEALVKQYQAAIKVIESKTLPKWVHNKSIQKAIESYRIDSNIKSYLRSLKIKE